jgi:hypothetical protein
MDETLSRSKPLQIELDSQYLGIDLMRVKLSFENFVSRDAGFSKPLDNAFFEIVTDEGKRQQTGLTPSAALEVFELVKEGTHYLTLHISVQERTKNVGIPLIAEEYVYFVIDFSRRSILLTISIRELRKAREIQKLLTEGIELVTVQLPKQHEYMEPYLHSFLADHPSTEQNVFLIMRFKDEHPFPDIVEAVRSTCAERGLNVVRADDKEYTDDLWDNVLTYLYGCDYAIAVFDQINYREFNRNVALEVGFLFAQCKRVLLLKDVSISVMPADIVGKIYRPFNTYDPLRSIPPQIKKWLEDYAIGEERQTTAL